MKKLPLIGLVLGAIAALFAFRKKKTPGDVDDQPATADDTAGSELSS